MVARARIALLVVVLAALAVPAAALAQAGLRASSPPGGAVVPAAPAGVRLALDAPVSTAFLRLDVTGPAGARVSGPARRDPGDPQAILAPVRAAGPGTYRVAWRAFSGDGHVSGGVLAFAVRRAAPAPPVPADPVRGGTSPLGVVARLLVLVGVLGPLGLLAARTWVAGAAWRQGGVWPPGPADRDGLRERASRPLSRAAGAWWCAWWAMLAAAALGLVLLPVAQLVALRAGPGGLGTLLTDTRWGRWLLVQAACVAAAAVLAVVAARGAARAPDPGPWRALLPGAPLAAAALAVSLAGHASSGTDVTVGVAVDALHAWATGLWLGGLVALVVLVTPVARALGGDDAVRFGAAAVVRFSALAVACVVVLVVTGVYRALAELSNLDDLWDTGYGRALAVKLGLFGVMLLGGAYNRLMVHPRLERAALGLEPSDRGALAGLGRSVRAELVLGLGVMACAAVLTALAPPTG